MQAIDWTAYHTNFATLARQHGFVCIPIASTGGGEITGWEKPAGRSGRPVVYLSAGIHGDEPAGPLAILELLARGQFHDALNWRLCPALNPEGLRANTRENSIGEDLNRDYWNRRSKEIAAHAAWLEALSPPDLFISLHEDWETSGFYFYEINLGMDRPERAAAILDAVNLPIEPSAVIDDHDVRSKGWIYHAAEADLPSHWPEAIFMAKHGCPLSFTFETPSSAALNQRVDAHIAAVLACLRQVVP